MNSSCGAGFRRIKWVKDAFSNGVMERQKLLIKVPFLEGFVDRRWVSAIVCILLGLTVLIIYLQQGPKAVDFIRAETLAAKWTSLSGEDSALFTEMSKALNKVPTLQKKYEPVIVQKLMEMGKSNEALQIAYRTLDLARSEVPYHAHFAETSLLIEQGEYQKALERAANLKERMSRECNVTAFYGKQLVGGALLFAHNLLRIACLQQELKNKPGEMAAWKELEEFLSKEEGSATYHLLLSNFQEKGVDLMHYVAKRKAVLKADTSISSS